MRRKLAQHTTVLFLPRELQLCHYRFLNGCLIKMRSSVAGVGAPSWALGWGGLCPHQQCFGCEGFPCLLPALPPISALITVNNNCHQLPGPTVLGLPSVWPGQILVLPAALAEDEGSGEGAGHILPTAGISHWGTQHRQGMLLSWGGSGPRVTLCCCLPISCLWRETPAEALVPQVRFGLSLLPFLVLLV